MNAPAQNSLIDAAPSAVDPLVKASAGDRYAATNALWLSNVAPAITRIEAERAARALYRKFGRRAGYPRQRSDARLREVRRCWISLKPCKGLDRGWARLVHDVSHDIFRKRYPQFRPHHPLHAKLENEISHYVIRETDWLQGGLQPKARGTVADPAAKRLEHARKMLDEHTRKLRREQALVKKWQRRVSYNERAIAKRGES